MSPSFYRINYDDILNQLNNTSAWFQKIGLKTDNSRFSEIMGYMEIICDYHKKNEVEKLIEEYDNEILWYAILESAAFLEINQAFQGIKDHLIPRGKLKEVLNGPFLPREEAPKDQNIHARNTLLELQVAANIKNSGIDVIGFDDVDFIFNGFHFNVQCKRIHSAKMIEENVNKAIHQISGKINGIEEMKGFICLSIDKLTDKVDKLLIVKNVDFIPAEMTKITSEFIERYHNYWRKTLNIKILACIIYFQAAAIIEDQNLLTRCQQLEIDPIAIPENLQGAEYSIIKEFSAIMSCEKG